MKKAMSMMLFNALKKKISLSSLMMLWSSLEVYVIIFFQGSYRRIGNS